MTWYTAKAQYNAATRGHAPNGACTNVWHGTALKGRFQRENLGFLTAEHRQKSIKLKLVLLIEEEIDFFFLAIFNFMMKRV